MQMGIWHDLYESPLGCAPEGAQFYRYTGWHYGLYNTPDYDFAGEEGTGVHSGVRVMSDEEVARMLVRRGPAPLRYWVVPRLGLSKKGRPMNHRVVLEREPEDGIKDFMSEIPAGYEARKLSDPEEYLGWLLSINPNGNGSFMRLLWEFSEDPQMVGSVSDELRSRLQMMTDWLVGVRYFEALAS